MSITFQGYRPRPWKLALRDPLDGVLRIRFFAREADARRAEEDEAALVAREKVLLRRVRPPRSVRTGITVEELSAAYLASNHLRAVTMRTTRSHLAPMLRLYRQRRVHTLGADEMRVFVECQLVRGVGRTTISLRLTRFLAVVKWGVDTGRLRRLPPIQISVPRGRSRRVAPPSMEELRRLLAHAAPHVQRVILLGLYSGARIGPSELFRLRWEDVDLDEGVIRMPNAAKGCGNEMRTIPIHPELLSLLSAWMRQDADSACSWVIHWRGRPMRSIAAAWRTAKRAAGITRRLRPYDLRHAFATYALAGGADIGSVAVVMGHRSSAMILRVYQHVQHQQLRDAVNRVPAIPGASLRGLYDGWPIAA